ncbi:hypothetical protein [Homoserinimonas sp. OAct 916]|uniref:hypothetical protein n=1 Tax=Homoserinimonas sp. OAct 916 TaxID=2211450 RepID=UPI00130049A8|nr:hypothetical protein [Homoserinimonas sp. OAct 916]
MTSDDLQPGANPQPVGEFPKKRNVVPTARTPRRYLVSMAIVWASAVVGVLLVAWFAPHETRAAWLAMVFAATVVLTFVIQLALQRPKGFLHRATMSTLGALIVLAAGTLILQLTAGSG